MTIDFRSDNTHGASPEIAEAVVRVAAGRLTSYGEDQLTARVRERCRAIFECDLEIFPVLTGTAANALAIASMTPPWGGVFCHEDAHIHRDELGAPEFFTGGAKLFPIAGADGKLHAADLKRAIHAIGEEGRTAKPSCVSITQATEAGTVYGLDEIHALRTGLGMHMDGARFTNALVSLGCTPAELTWKAGVDVLTFGATKNGAMAAELIVVFRKELAAEIAPRWHRGGHRLSKMRFLSAQLDAYLTDDLWLRNARRANEAAQRLARGLGDDVIRPVAANVVFARFPAETEKALREQGFLFYDWPLFGDGAVRLVCGFSTTDADVDALVTSRAALRPRMPASGAAR
jgi:threonine aldolase